MTARPPPAERQRIDKWLWHARIARTRTAAQKLAVSGKVRVNRDRCELSSRPVHVGDVLTITLDRGVRFLRVVGFGERRGPAGDARLLYDDISAPAPPAAATATAPRREPGAGRPTKRDRRAMEVARAAAWDTGPPDE